MLPDLGIQLTNLCRIVLTHQDYEHIGSLAELAQLSGAEILASPDAADVIDGTVLPRFALPETPARRPELREVAAQYQPTSVNVRLTNGQRLDLAGGVRVIFIPSHTPGHIALYLDRSRSCSPAPQGRRVNERPETGTPCVGARPSCASGAASVVWWRSARQSFPLRLSQPSAWRATRWGGTSRRMARCSLNRESPKRKRTCFRRRYAPRFKLDGVAP